MPSPQNFPEEREDIRLTLNLSLEANALLIDLAEKTGSTISDVLRKAIALLAIAVEAKRQGKKIGIAENDQVLATEIVGICANSS